MWRKYSTVCAYIPGNRFGCELDQNNRVVAIALQWPVNKSIHASHFRWLTSTRRRGTILRFRTSDVCRKHLLHFDQGFVSSVDIGPSMPVGKAGIAPTKASINLSTYSLPFTEAGKKGKRCDQFFYPTLEAKVAVGGGGFWGGWVATDNECQQRFLARQTHEL